MTDSKQIFKFLIVFSIWFLSIKAIATNPLAIPDVSNKSWKEIKNQAKNALKSGDTYTALFYHEEWANRKPEDTKVKFHVAELYRKTRDYVEAEKWYLKVYDADPKHYPLALYYAARMQMNQGKYEEAKKNHKAFGKIAGDLKDPAYKKLSKSDMKGAELALSLNDTVNEAVAIHMGTEINKPHVEFSPIPYKDSTIIFGSLRDEKVNYYDLNDSVQKPIRKFYTATKKEGQWQVDGEFKGPFNDTLHIGNGSISTDGKRFFFTKCAPNWQNKIICKIYVSHKTEAGWSNPEPMNDMINLEGYTNTQPTLGRESKKNADVLYFISDRPGGKGGLDIWYSEYNIRRKEFKNPRNLSSKINSPGTEFTPYYDLASHTLYYSSDGKPGLGGLDVFKTEGEKSKWEDPVNLLKEINSPADDFHYTIDESKRHGYFVSNRKGGVALLNETCCDDIYEFKYTKYLDIQVSGQVFDSSDCLPGATLSLFIINNDKKQERFLSKQVELEDCEFNIPLQQGIDYKIEISKEGYFNDVIDFSTKDVKSSQDITLAMELLKIPSEPIVLNNILYEFNSAKLTDSAKVSIDTSLYMILTDNPNMVIELSSHTDSKGTDSYNQRLSERRAQSVVKYLVSKGISKKRMKAKGYGESRPIAPNENSDGSDNPEGRRKNRRTEFRILGKIDLIDLAEDDDPEETSSTKKSKKN